MTRIIPTRAVLSLVLATCAVGLLALPSGANATLCVPQSASGANEYLPTLPGSVCTVTPSDSGSGRVLPPRTRRRLAAVGPIGRAILGLTAASSPEGLSGSQTGRRRDDGRSRETRWGFRFLHRPRRLTQFPLELSESAIRTDWPGLILLGLILLLPLLGFMVPWLLRQQAAAG